MKPPLVVIIPKTEQPPARPKQRPADRRDYQPKPKLSPVAVAHGWLGKRLVEKESGFWLDGRPVSLDQLMRETNRLLKAAGIEQILTSERWKV